MHLFFENILQQLSSPGPKVLITFCPESVCLKSFHILIIPRTTGPISTELSTKYPWVKGIQVCPNEGPHPSPRGDNIENVKLYETYLKIFFRITHQSELCNPS